MKKPIGFEAYRVDIIGYGSWGNQGATNLPYWERAEESNTVLWKLNEAAETGESFDTLWTCWFDMGKPDEFVLIGKDGEKIPHRVKWSTEDCKHPATRQFAGVADENGKAVLWVACCDCGEVTQGEIKRAKKEAGNV